jgi:signal transduction histidine kinase
MVTLQFFNVTVALTSFVLASLFDSWERSEEMKRRYESERLAGEAKSAFLNMAAHELRTPLSVITGYLSLLMEGSLGTAPDGWRRPLEVLRNKAAELNKMVDDLLVSSRIEANALAGGRRQVDLCGVVRAAAERARPRAQLLQGEIVTELGPEAAVVDGDEDQLGRIFDNLLNNSLTYTEASPRIAISVSVEDGRAIARVADNGIGIRQAERERIFDRFHRSNDPAFQRMPGTGLGLYISRELAEQHGGSLKVEGERPGGGTVFALCLPLAKTSS